MQGINIAKVIAKKRKEKGTTQDELARFIGVSKASVSKWETGQSFPDIVFLPQLAAYFNISLDELMSYEPQMADKDIRKLYEELADEFAIKPFEEVRNRCRAIVKTYFSCFSLLYHMGILYVNYSWPCKDDDQRISTIAEAKELFARVKAESDDLNLQCEALRMEATCEMMLDNPNALIDLLKDANVWRNPKDVVLLSQAYAMTGRMQEAKTELQRSIFESTLGFINTIPAYLCLCADNPAHLEETCQRTMELIRLFNLKFLYPTLLMPFYLTAAQVFATNGNMERSLCMLEEYTAIAVSDIYPLKIIKGDNFFTLLDDSLKECTIMPRDEKSIKQSMADEVIENPAFAVLADDPRFTSLTRELVDNI